MPRLYLISKWGDVLLGATTGIWGYWLYERRLHRPDGERLADLVRWKLDQRATLAALKAPATATSQADQDGWDELERELRLKEQDALRQGVRA
ncbi:hypothetical protein JCM3775_005376 [Rhodotorula graminis]|uniref:Uncharacterized protein n=1 Tax=Rhodotorula graminis (strain WP1) TaxID=578459 RepID=A0A194S425_RHOGW|nr:uncharacterized protein RHOBADRAFT_43753 [Rhodotorula graminis WP1]KPV75265.1 hypothetical protein RHOBADRAFT_43753 [Rhodotorula graminis WP1]